MREFVHRESPLIIRDLMGSQLPDSLRVQQAEIQAFTESLIPTIIDILLERSNPQILSLYDSSDLISSSSGGTAVTDEESTSANNDFHLQLLEIPPQNVFNPYSSETFDGEMNVRDGGY